MDGVRGVLGGVTLDDIVRPRDGVVTNDSEDPDTDIASGIIAGFRVNYVSQYTLTE